MRTPRTLFWIVAVLPVALACGIAVAQTEPIDPDRVGSGELLWRSADGWAALPVVETDVELHVTGIVVHGRVVQRFRNATEEVIEALYVFPLPDRAAVHRMEMTIGERRIRSIIEERERAKRTYEQARTTGRKAALVEQQRPNLFTTSAANINPGEEVAIVLEYFEEIEYEDGIFGLRFPLTFAPRFTPPAVSDEEPATCAPFVPADAPLAPRARIRARIDAGRPLERIESSSHAVDVREEQGAFVVGTRDETVVADRDFVLEWEPLPGDRPEAALFLERHAGEEYALLLLLPPGAKSGAGLGLPTETLFVIDVSGSMRGPSIAQAREALLAALERLRPDDRFNIVKFNDHTEAFRPDFQPAEGDALEAARGWVAGLDADGGTMILPALTRGLELLGGSRSSRAQRMIFLTDGAIGDEAGVLRAIAERLGTARLHTLGIGQAPNAYLMRKMARRGRGLCKFLSPGETTENGIRVFFDRLERPVMTDVELDFHGLDVAESYPKHLPDLHAGEPLVVSLRLGGPAEGAEIALRGFTREGWLESSLTLDGEVSRGSGVAVRWARAKVGSLMDSLHEGADPEAVRREVVDHALAFDLVTRYTSLVAVDDSPTALGTAVPARVASALPAGGTNGPLRRLVGLGLSALGLALFLGARMGRPS